MEAQQRADLTKRDAVRCCQEMLRTVVPLLSYDQPTKSLVVHHNSKSGVHDERMGPWRSDPKDSENSSSNANCAVPDRLTVKPKRKRLKTPRRREQCRVNQARYREKQITKENTLEAQVQSLREHIERLRVKQQTLQIRLNTCNVASQTVMTLVHLLRHGLMTKGIERSMRSPSRDQQLAFIMSSVHEHVHMGETYSRASFVDQLVRFTYCFGNLHTILDSITNRNITNPNIQDPKTTTLHATAKLHMTITSLSIQQVFPYLLLPRNHGIQQKLLGQHIVCELFLMAVFNEIDEKIVQLGWTIDFVGAFNCLLPLHDVAVVLQEARIEHDAYLLVPLSQDEVHNRGCTVTNDIYRVNASRTWDLRERINSN